MLLGKLTFRARLQCNVYLKIDWRRILLVAFTRLRDPTTSTSWQRTNHIHQWTASKTTRRTPVSATTQPNRTKAQKIINSWKLRQASSLKQHLHSCTWKSKGPQSWKSWTKWINQHSTKPLQIPMFILKTHLRKDIGVSMKQLGKERPVESGTRITRSYCRWIVSGLAQICSCRSWRKTSRRAKVSRNRLCWPNTCKEMRSASKTPWRKDKRSTRTFRRSFHPFTNLIHNEDHSGEDWIRWTHNQEVIWIYRAMKIVRIRSNKMI